MTGLLIGSVYYRKSLQYVSDDNTYTEEYRPAIALACPLSWPPRSAEPVQFDPFDIFN